MNKSSKSNGGRKRAARGTGRLFKKQGSKQFRADSPAAGSYYLTYTVGGKRITTSLRDAQGNAITDRQEAEIERKRILAPFQTNDEAEALRVIHARIQDAESRHVQAVDEANPPLRIEQEWAAFMRSSERPDSGERTLSDYAAYWKRFETWLARTHPEVEHLRDITRETAKDYADDLTAGSYYLTYTVGGKRITTSLRDAQGNAITDRQEAEIERKRILAPFQTNDEAEALRAEGGLSPNSFNKHIGLLKLAFRVLGDSAGIAVNPFAKIRRKKQRTHSRRELSIPELTTVLDHAEGGLALLLYLGACTGLRLGDCCTLTWGNVDLARGIIRRIPNKNARSETPVKVVVGIPSALHERLAATPAKKRTGYVLPEYAKQYEAAPERITNAVKALFLDCGIDVHAPGTGHQITRNADGVPERDTDGKVFTEAGAPYLGFYARTGGHSGGGHSSQRWTLQSRNDGALYPYQRDDRAGRGEGVASLC